MMTELDHKYAFKEMSQEYFKRNIDYFRLYMEKYSVTYQTNARTNKVSIKYNDSHIYTGCTYIAVVCSFGVSPSYSFYETIPVNNIELLKILTNE